MATLHGFPYQPNLNYWYLHSNCHSPGFFLYSCVKARCFSISIERVNEWDCFSCLLIKPVPGPGAAVDAVAQSSTLKQKGLAGHTSQAVKILYADLPEPLQTKPRLHCRNDSDSAGAATVPPGSHPGQRIIRLAVCNHLYLTPPGCQFCLVFFLVVFQYPAAFPPFKLLSHFSLQA